MSTTVAPFEASVAAPPGGSFLIDDPSPEQIFTPEDFSEEQRRTGATADRFMSEEVVPAIPDYERKAPGVARGLVEKAAEIGLPAVLVPEQYDGFEMDVTTQMVVNESVGRYASFSTTYGAHAGIGTLPLVFFGTEEQKRKYLPKLVTAELLGAYCLSEPQAGSDALASLTRAELAPDGRHYLLNGQKMWISNGGWADLFTVFAKVDGEKFSAFLVERSWEGVRPGAEEHKMGIHGSSTTALYLDNVKVPVENLLGEVGRGHVIAFNVLNLGRLKLGSSCIGGAKSVIADAARYANQRKAFGRPIADFGAIRQKLADMTAKTFAGESLVYRTSGMIDARLEGFSWDAPGAAKTALKAIEEYAVECSIAKVYLSEILDFAADEAVQIHGGYGFHRDYAVERSYRDSRINRIFEGTNEINRLLITGMLLKRASQERLDLQGAIRNLMFELAGGRVARSSGGPFPVQRDMVGRAKKATLAMAGLAYRKFGARLEEQQEVAAAIADMAIETYAAESAMLRAEKAAAAGRGETTGDIVTVLAQAMMCAVGGRAALIAGACAEGGELEQYSKMSAKLTRFTPANLPAARDRIAARVLAAEKYVF